MTQVHRRFSDEQVRNLLRSYEEGFMERSQVEDVLGISKTRFFALLKLYRKAPRPEQAPTADQEGHFILTGIAPGAYRPSTWEVAQSEALRDPGLANPSSPNRSA